MAEEGWTEGLERLDTKQTRARLAALIDKCKFVAPSLEHHEAQGLRDQVHVTEYNLRLAAQAEIRRLSEKLTEYRSGPLPPEPAPKATTYDAHAAAAARWEARKAAEAAAAAEPTPEEPEAAPPPPPATRPVLPARPMRLPSMNPGRSS